MYSTGSLNLPHFNNPEMDKCINDAASTYDFAQRHQLYIKCQNIDYENVYYGYVWAQKWNWVFQKKVKGFPPTMTSDWGLRPVWLER